MADALFPHLLYVLALLLLGVLLLQDMRERVVSVVLFPMLLICLAALALQKTSAAGMVHALPRNVLFLLLQLALLYAYFWIRQRKYTAVLGQLMGWGDVLFWLVTAVLFSPANFIFFFLSSLLFSLCLHLLFSAFHTGTYHKKVPLAGLQALYLSLLLTLQWRHPEINFFDDYLILGFLI